jgi:hypothetical protein
VPEDALPAGEWPLQISARHGHPIATGIVPCMENDRAYGRAAALKWPVPIPEAAKLRVKRKVAAVHEELEQLRQTHALRAASEGMKVAVLETRSRPPLEADHRGVNLLQRISSKPNPGFTLL